MSGSELPELAGEHHECGPCGFSYPDVAIEDAVVALTAVPARVRAAVGSVAPEVRRTRPDPATWSVVEYACHVRDVFATFTVRLHRTSVEDRPALEPMYADLRAERFRYRESDPDRVLDELAVHVRGFLDEIAATTEWSRTATRRPEEERTAAWLVRHALHEAHHHVRDIVDVGRAAAPG